MTLKNDTQKMTLNIISLKGITLNQMILNQMTLKK
jgi:hypothetical protein